MASQDGSPRCSRHHHPRRIDATSDQKIIFTALTLLAVAAVPSIVHAEDDNVFDGKSYPGVMCSPVVSSVAAARTGSSYANTSGFSAAAICPVIQDSWLSTTGLALGQMKIQNVGGGVTFSCTQTAYNSDGVFLSSRSFSTTTAGLSGQLFGTAVNFLPTTGLFGYITIQCTVPAGGQIKGYQVQEKA